MNSRKYLSDKELEVLEASLMSQIALVKPTTLAYRDLLLLLLAIKTGARASELLMLTTSSFNAPERSLLIVALKGGVDRELPLPNAVASLLESYIANSVYIRDGSDNRLFRVTYKRLFQIWHMYRTKEKCFHSLRHSIGVRLYKQSRDIHLVKQVLGHKSINNTMIYLTFVRSQEELRQWL